MNEWRTIIWMCACKVRILLSGVCCSFSKSYMYWCHSYYMLCVFMYSAQYHRCTTCAGLFDSHDSTQMMRQEDLFVYTCSFMMVELATFIIWVCGEFDSLRSGALNHSTLLPLYKHTVKMSLQEWPRLTNTQQSRKNIYRDHRLLFHCQCIESTASTAETLPHWYTMLLDPTQWFFYMNSLPTDPHNIRCNVGKLRVQTA